MMRGCSSAPGMLAAARRATAPGATAALVALLALSGCATLGLDTPGPLAGGGADEPGATSEATAGAAAGSLPLPEPQQAPDAPDEGADPAAAPGEPPSDPASGDAPDQLAAAEAQGATDAAAAADAPHVYMALQPDRAGSTSVVFAIDQSRDGTPSDEPAIRITPEEIEAQSGRCNPQQLRYYKFPPENAGQPVYGPEEASRGIGARELPEFMATAVSAEMMERGIAEDLEGTRPQNVCTRKLFEQTIIAATTGQG